MLHSQHFYNKLEVVSCYWFKFEPNTKITCGVEIEGKKEEVICHFFPSISTPQFFF